MTVATYTRAPNDYRGAHVSPCTRYRYHLWRVWGDPTKRACFVMLNPSTADATTDDPTIRRCTGFAQAWGFGALDVVNLYAYRATDPEELYKAHNPIGPANDTTIRRVAERASVVVAAWGAHPTASPRDASVLGILAVHAPGFVMRLGPPTKSGQPRHPLYLPKNTGLEVHR